LLPNRAGVEETLFVPIGSPPNLTFITGYCRSAYRQIGTEKRPQNLIFLLFLEMYLQIEPPPNLRPEAFWRRTSGAF
jgi:hypothetical protein